MTAIAYIVFNRPDETRVSFEQIRRLRPAQLFIIADGPRASHPGDESRCSSVRRLVDEVDWPCEVHRNYAEENQGLKLRVTSGLDWVFSSVDKAVVLEDDCVAHPDFFRFCDNALDRYAEDSRVFMVTGNNFQHGLRRGTASYYFSKYTHVWGWASWRRVWELYDRDMAFWPTWRGSAEWNRVVPDRIERRYWTRIFDRVANGKIDSWAYPMLATAWYYQGLTATPNANLVSNIGFGPLATHTFTPDAGANLPTEALGAITHPTEVRPDFEADRHAFDTHFNGASLRARSTPTGFVRAAASAGRRYVSGRLSANKTRLGSASPSSPLDYNSQTEDEL